MRAALGIMLAAALTAFAAIETLPEKAFSKPALPRFELETIRGYAGESTGSIAIPGIAEAGFRLKNSGSRGFIQLTSIGLLNRAVLGNFKLYVGEGWLSGGAARFFYAGRPRLSNRPLIRLSPSLSQWNAGLGGAFSASLGGAQAVAAVFKRDARSAAFIRSMDVFLGAAYRFDRANVGCGIFLGPGIRNSQEPGKSSMRAFNMFGSFAAGSLEASSEVDFAGGMFGSFEIYLRNPARLSVRFFHLPDLYAVGDWKKFAAGSGDSARGIKIALWTEISRPRLDLSTTVRRKNSGQYSNYRCELSVSGRGAAFYKWKAVLQLQRKQDVVYRRGAFALPPIEKAYGEVRVKTKTSMRGRVFSQSIGLDLFINGEKEPQPGAILAIGLGCSKFGFDTAFKITRYALPAGKTALLTRPSIAASETFHIVSGRGIDMSLRVRANLGKILRAECYYGVPAEGETRFYAGLRCRY